MRGDRIITQEEHQNELDQIGEEILRRKQNEMKLYYVSINEEKEYNFTVIARNKENALDLVNDYIYSLLARTTFWGKWNIPVNPVIYYSQDIEEGVISSPVQFYTGELYREKYEKENWWKFWKG